MCLFHDTERPDDNVVFSRSRCGSCVSCLPQTAEVVLVLGFLQASWGCTAVLFCVALWEHFLWSDRRILSSQVLPLVLCKHSRWRPLLASPLRSLFAGSFALSPWLILCTPLRFFRYKKIWKMSTIKKKRRKNHSDNVCLPDVFVLSRQTDD